MSRVITFRQTFMPPHPRKGERTYFVEKIINQVRPNFNIASVAYLEELYALNPDKPQHIIETFWNSLFSLEAGTKSTTIRPGTRFKAGDWFSPRVWSAKPYNSPCTGNTR